MINIFFVNEEWQSTCINQIELLKIKIEDKKRIICVTLK
jgi:hypothetical protein